MKITKKQVEHMADYQELLDVVDENDEIIGQDTREDIHKQGLLHREVYVILYDHQKQALFQLRSQSRDTNPGKLTVSASGHVDLGSTYNETAVKELKEELGLSLKIDDLKFLGIVHNNTIDKQTNTINNALRAVYCFDYRDDINKLFIQKDELDLIKWIKLEDIINPDFNEKDKFVTSIFKEEMQEIFKRIKDF